MNVLSDMIQWLHYHLGTARTVQVLVITGVIVGLLMGLLGMFLFIAFISTRIRRDDKFPLKDRIDTLNFEIGGKRITTAPHPKNVKESMKILLDAILWTLFKRKPIHYKSIRTNMIIFSGVVGLATVLALGCGVATSDAFMAQIKNNKHYVKWARYYAKSKALNHTHNAYAYTKTEVITPKAPVHIQSTQPEPVQPTQQDQRPEKQNTTENIAPKWVVQYGQPDHRINHTYPVERQMQIQRSRIEVFSNRNEENSAVKTQTSKSSQFSLTNQSSQPATRLVQEVTSDGRQIVQRVSPDKVVNTVQNALSSGAVKITIQLP